jgi:hypothetical protein
MQLYRYFPAILLSFCFSLFAQKPAITLEMLSFHSSSEEKAFKAISEGDTNFLQLIMLASPTVDSLQLEANLRRLDSVFEQLDSAKLVRKSPKKIIKIVFNTIHNNLFRKYEERNQICEIFETGYYNCVSASFMYSYMLGRLGIPHQVMETPNHVYVLAFPDDETWVLESTDPTQGFYEIEPPNYDSYIQSLLDQKLITQTQLISPDIDSILDALNENEAATLARLVSIQYQNQAIYDAEDGKTGKALQNYLKAKYICPEADYHNAGFFLLSWLEEENYKNPFFFDFLRLGYKEMPAQEQMAVPASISYYSQSYLEGKIGLSVYNQWLVFYQEITASNDSARAAVMQIYYHTLSTKAIVDQKPHLVLKNAKLALAISDTSFTSANLLLSAIGSSINQGLWSNSMAFDSVRHYVAVFPALLEFPLWRDILVSTYLEEAIMKINAKDVQQAKKQLEAMEKVLKGQLPETVNDAYVALAYSKVAHYAYRSSKTEALIWLEKGLIYSPNSSLLLGLKDYYRKH